MQALRIWNAAIDTLQRLNPKRAPAPVERNPFDMEELVSALPAPQAEHAGNKPDDVRTLDTNPGPKGWHWILFRGLFDIQISLSQYSVYKGDPRGSEYFIRQAHSLADALHAPVAISKAICLHITLLMMWKKPIKVPGLFTAAEQLTDRVSSYFMAAGFSTQF
jgi:separase